MMQGYTRKQAYTTKKYANIKSKDTIHVKPLKKDEQYYRAYTQKMKYDYMSHFKNSSMKYLILSFHPTQDK